VDSQEVRRQWAERSGEYSPDYYAYYGPDATSESVWSIVDRLLGPDASILELGCSSGRHLAHLHEHGYEDLAGIEVNEDAFDVMEETYPELAEAGSFYCDTIESVVEDLPDDRFDAVFSVETLQHLHPKSAWVYQELARVADDLIVTIENEGDRSEGGNDRSESAENRALEDQRETEASGIKLINDEFPLYYRNWGAIFTDVGLEQVEVTAEEGTTVHDGDTVRAFQTPAE